MNIPMSLTIYFILMVWSATSLIYSMIKKVEVGVQAFIVLTPFLINQIMNIIYSENFMLYVA